ncbi:MAG: hypothetical protein IPP88_21950 [Betaproteobacteria bacterium]|nr:hypothetical protein [Betaproteobacteria bacterium]
MSSASAESQSLTFQKILDRPGLVTTRPNHKIAYGKDALQYGELWLPSGASKGPTGGRADSRRLLACGVAGAETRVAFLADDLRASTVSRVWSLTYRRVGHNGGGYPGSFNDIANGVTICASGQASSNWICPARSLRDTPPADISRYGSQRSTGFLRAACPSANRR